VTDTGAMPATNETTDVAAEFTIVGGSPTHTEVAAVTAVLLAAVEDESADAAPVDTQGPSAWERSQRAIRAPLHPGAGAWRGFSA
jgi:hypothetical protein